MGHINQDVIIGIDDIPKFGSTEVKNLKILLGGTGANIALVASRLDVPLTLLSKVSQKFPEELLSPLHHRNIKLKLERSDEEGPVCYIIDAREEQIAFMFQGPMNSPGSLYSIESRYCHFATSNPKWILSLMDRCKGKKVFDPGQEISYRWNLEELRMAMKKSDIIILNRNEYDYSRDIIPDGKDLIITLGKEGCSYNGKIIRSKRQSGRSTVGAGDAFRAGLYASLYRGNDILKACECANTVAGYYVEYERSLDLLDWRVLCEDNDV
ncbi:MAG: PfkB family carbohydrate kinase [Thermoplasmata archaeon]